MDANRFDAIAVTRSSSKARSRRGVVSGLMLGTLGLLGRSNAPAAVAAADCTKIKNKQKRQQCRKRNRNVCAGKNWCIDRTQACGPAGGFGKCLVQAYGGNVCGEILFQAATCAACEPANRTNCRCVLAAGGGDRCNNGPSGADFICVRPV